MEWKEPEQRFIEKLSKQFGFSPEETERRILKEKYGQSGIVVEDGEIRELKTSFIEEQLKAANQAELDHLSCTDRWELEKQSNKTPLKEPVDYSDLCHLQDLSLAVNHEENGDDPLDFSYFPQLKRLFVHNSNAESFLLTGCPLLENISTRGCYEIRGLDFSKNPLLREITVMFNKLEELDITENSLLEEVYTSSKYLKTIKISPGGRLRRLSAQQGSYSSLPLGNCPCLRQLAVCFSEMDRLDTLLLPNLMELRVGHGQIKELDISGLSLLQEFIPFEMQIDRLLCNEMQAMTFKFLKKLSKLKPSEEQSRYIKRVELFQKAVNHNWDEGFAKLNAILKNPLCDRATALAIYWMGQPGYFLQYEKANEVSVSNRKHYNFIKKLEKRILEGEFLENQLPLDPSSLAGFNRREEAAAYESDTNMIPEELKKVLSGSTCPHFDMERKIELQIKKSD
jgi:hypothetical protein